MITAEGDTLEEARTRLKSLVPDGSFIVSEKVVCDGERRWLNCTDVTVEADSLERAWEELRSRTPDGFEVVHELLRSEATLGTIRKTAYTDEGALVDARFEAPRGSIIIAERILVPAIEETFTVAAFSEEAATRLAMGQCKGPAEIHIMSLVSEGKRGFLGVGRKPSRYSIVLSLRRASVEVDHLIKAKLRVTLAEVVRPKAVIEVAVVKGVDGLVEAMCAFAKGDNALQLDGHRILESLEGVQDERIAPILLDCIKRQLRDGDVRPARTDLLNKLLGTMERLGARSLRGETIDLIFGNILAFTELHVPDLFGRYTDVLRALVTAFTPIVASSKVGWQDNDGYETWFRYETTPLESALAALCATNDPVSTNLLHKLWSLPRIAVPRGSSDRGDPGVEDPTEGINLRQRARNEIVHRGAPAYDFEAYKADEHY